MSQTVTVPVFGSNNSNGPATQSSNENDGWNVDSGSGDPMDFDLLAEYLLDDPQGNSGGVSFDFNVDTSANASVVSPEQSEDGRSPPVAETTVSGAAQAQQIITQHANTVQIQPHPQPQPAPAPIQTQHLQHIHHQQPQQLVLAAMPAPAPAPIAAQTHAMAPGGIPMPPAPAPASTVVYAAHGGVMMPTPVAPAVAPAPPLVHQHHQQQPNNVKRRRIDAPVMAIASAAPGTAVVSDHMAVAAALQGRGRKKTQAQIDRRRERNRILARRTRLRKKFFFESLQKEVIDLQRENAALKGLVRGKIQGQDSNKILDECTAVDNLPQAVIEACGDHVAGMDQQDFNLVKSIQQSQHCFVITDPSLQDNPIVFASDDFLSLTGYTREEVLGRNCRFLQGTETSKSKLDEIRKGLAVGDDVSVTLVNYTADGTPFWNKLFIAALRDAQNNIVNFIGVLTRVASPSPDDPEHGKQLPSDISAEENDVSDPLQNSFDADGAVKAIEGAVDAAVSAAAQNS